MFHTKQFGNFEGQSKLLSPELAGSLTYPPEKEKTNHRSVYDSNK